MISPQLRPEAAPSRPRGPSDGRFNVSLENTPPPPDAGSLVVAMGADMTSRATTDAVVNGLWHTLLGSLVAGLAVSAVLGGVVLAIGYIG
jgi:hypothetical protein